MQPSSPSVPASWPSPADAAAPAVLISGGLDSAILLSEAQRHYAAVHPLYVRFGLAWEGVELHHLRHFLERTASPALGPLQVFDLPVRDLYGSHWSITGRNVPDADSPDEAVFLPGRNALLLIKPLLWCHQQGIPVVALGSLQSNPFPDATPAFFTAYEQAINRAVGGQVHIVCPFAGLTKVAVMQRGRDLPLEWTFSCIHPQAGRHCGRCNKCAERRRAFATAGMADPTRYATEDSCTA